MNGKQVRLFLVDGTVGGLMTAEILNWTGHMLRALPQQLQPPLLAQFRKRWPNHPTARYSTSAGPAPMPKHRSSTVNLLFCRGQ